MFNRKNFIITLEILEEIYDNTKEGGPPFGEDA